MSDAFSGMTREEAAAFAARWLPAWTGNDPQRLVSFYAEDAFYSDPAIPDGVRGRAALLGYFERLLRRYPDWVWYHTDATPMEGGFLNHWRAEIPSERGVIACDGVCTVALNDEGLITRNCVFFDRTPLLA